MKIIIVLVAFLISACDNKPGQKTPDQFCKENPSRAECNTQGGGDGGGLGIKKQ